MQESERLAETLLRRRGQVQNSEVRCVQQGPLAVLKSIDKPSVLVELGFFTNVADRRLLADSKSLDRYSKQLADGIADYFG
jgi:N-acetylmuramoyl-L-alanine amidase